MLFRSYHIWWECKSLQLRKKCKCMLRSLSRSRKTWAFRQAPMHRFDRQRESHSCNHCLEALPMQTTMLVLPTQNLRALCKLTHCLARFTCTFWAHFFGKLSQKRRSWKCQGVFTLYPMVLERHQSNRICLMLLALATAKLCDLFSLALPSPFPLENEQRPD